MVMAMATILVFRTAMPSPMIPLNGMILMVMAMATTQQTNSLTTHLNGMIPMAMDAEIIRMYFPKTPRSVWIMMRTE